MTDHDPLCPRHESGRDPVWGFGAAGECQCNQIARVRADEREHHGNNCRGMWDEWVHDLRAQVEALESPLHWNDGEDALIYRSQVLALLGGES